uniref:amino acid adenylation domain-containing protein n=1 Tax=Ascidiimonas aurantiaca TaxID=1685432 RepID=UPI0030EB2A98
MKELLKRIQEQNILLKLVDGELKLFTNNAEIDPAIISEIRQNKQALIHFLSDFDEDEAADTNKKDIVPAEKSEHYPLSSSQLRMWVVSQFEEASLSYHMPGVFKLKGKIEFTRLDKAFKDLIERHEILRTLFREDTDEVRQYILEPEELDFRLEEVDLTGTTAQEQAVDAVIKEDLQVKFDLEEGPLLRGKLIRLSPSDSIFYCTMHHLISDGWSMEVMIRELMLLYYSYAKQTSITLPPLTVQYKDYAVWQQERLKEGYFEKGAAYWKNQFEGELPVLAHFGDYPRPATKTYNGGYITGSVNATTYRLFKDWCRENKGTSFMGAVALVGVLLHKYTAQEDIIIGSPVAGREHTSLKDQIGFYVNTLALRLRFDRKDPFQKMFEMVRDVTMNAYDHQNYPFDELVEALKIEHDFSRSPLFDVMVVLQNANGGLSNISEMSEEFSVEPYETMGLVGSKFDLLFSFEETSTDLNIRLEYNKDIYAHETAGRLIMHLQQIIDILAHTPRTPVNKIPFLSASEEYKLLEEFNKTKVAYPSDSNIPELFRRQAEKTPDKIAIISGDVHMSYAELEQLSNSFANYLVSAHQVELGDFVGIRLPRNEWQLITVLGTLKAGAAYVPIDTDYPKERVAHMLEDSACKLLVEDQILQEFQSQRTIFSEEFALRDLEPDHLAYVMYTSGSTGQPKGAMIAHQSIIRLVKNTNYINLTEEETLLSTGAFSFDATTFEFWGMLLNGGKLVLCDQDTLLDYDRLTHIIREQEVTVMWFTSGWLNLLVDDHIELFKSLQTVLTGGDRLSVKHIKKLSETYPALTLINAYGPTENTTFSITYQIQAPVNTAIPIGVPINNSTAYVFNEDLQLCPIGVTGELFLGGDGISKGYLNQPELNAIKFINNPYKEERLYRTGDLAKVRANGIIDFVSRKDTQMKIRGYRIEPGEIEHHLQEVNEIESAIVRAHENDHGLKELVAYVVSDPSLNISGLRYSLSKVLPAHMIPDHFVILDALPLTANGKVDFKQLPAPKITVPQSEETYVAPETETEKKLARIWETVLSIKRVGKYDDFFELGGHSLKATRLINQIHEDFGIKIPFKDFFAATVLEIQAQLVEETAASHFTFIPKAEPADSYPLSATQRRLWILSQFEDANPAYNMPGVYEFKGVLNREAFATSFNKVLERHEILRTVFREAEDGTVQQVIRSQKEIGFQLSYTDLSHKNNSHTHLTNHLQEILIQPFDLSKGPLLRAGVFKMSKNTWIFAFTIHHIISDGWSLQVLMQDVLHCYNALVKGISPELPPLRIQYKDYALWQLQELGGDIQDSHKTYWLQKFSGEIPVLDISLSKKRPPVKTYSGAVYHGKIAKHLSEAFGKLLQESGATSFMGLLSAVKVLCHHYTQQTDITIGTPMAGREHIDLEGQIGFYVNTLALRTQFEATDSFIHVLTKVKQTVLEGYEHQMYPFDELVEALGFKRDLSRNPLFDIQVIVQNKEVALKGAQQKMDALEVQPYLGDMPATSVFDMVFNFIETDNGYDVSVLFNTDVYATSDVNQLFGHLTNLISDIVSNPQEPVRSLNILSDEDRTLILEDFNSLKLDYDRDKTVVDLFK